MRILAVADEVAEHLWAPEVRQYQPDLVVGCGDVPFDLLGWIADRTGAPLVFVPGNHDPDLSGYRQTRRGLVLRAGIPVPQPWPPGAINVDGRWSTSPGCGSPAWVARLGTGEVPISTRSASRIGGCDALLHRARRQRPTRPVDIVLTHAPIAGVGDGPRTTLCTRVSRPLAGWRPPSSRACSSTVTSTC